jgi:hypothetical protein
MKKLILLVLTLAIATPTFAGLKEKHILGKWSFSMETPDGTMTGSFLFHKKDGKLVGEVNTDQGDYVPLSNIEIRDNNVLYFEVETDYETLTVTLTIENKKTYTGIVGSQQADLEITGKKAD